jgi:hypothetical protein
MLAAALAPHTPLLQEAVMGRVEGRLPKLSTVINPLNEE